MADPLTSPGAEPPSEDRPDHPDRGRRRDVRMVLTGIALVLLVWFAVANFQDVQIHFWVKTEAAPLIVVVAISGFLGASATGLWFRLKRRRRAADAGRP